MKSSVIKRFIHNDTGATAVEFAVVASTFFLMMFGVIEYGLFTMTQVAIESAVTQAGRQGMIGSKVVNANGTTTPYATREDAVIAMIKARTSGLMNRNSVIISATPVAGASGGTTAPDLCLYESGTTPDSPATCPRWSDNRLHFYDTNGDGNYTGNGTTSAGAAGQLVEIRASYPWRVMFPFLGSFLGRDGVVLITSSTVVKNEPF